MSHDDLAKLGPLPEMPAIERRIIGGTHRPTTWEAFVPLVATLPDGSKVNLPVGTIIEQPL